MFDFILKAVITISTFFQVVYLGPVQDYLYVGPDKILELPSLTEVPCEQNYPNEKRLFSSAAVVPYGGADTLMLCEVDNCYAWRNSGWELSDTTFRRTMSASSKLLNGRWLISGGMRLIEDGDNIVLNTTRSYDETHGWVNWPPLPVPKYWHCQVTVTVGSGSGTYVIGGRNNVREDSTVFSLGNYSWIQEESLPIPLFDQACAVMGTEIYVIGGHNNDDGHLSSVWVKDTNITGSSWKNGPHLPEGRTDAQAFVYDNKIYVLSGTPDVTSVLTLSPNSQSWSVVPGADIVVARSIFPVPFINKDSVHCNN